MMDIGYILFIIACAILLVFAAQTARAMLRERDWLPKELAGARLLFSERRFASYGDVPLVARVDRAYLAGGRLHLVELKVRPGARIYEPDVIELSAQRVAVQASTGIDVSRRGFVVIENPTTRRRLVRAVELLAEERVIELMQRRRAILDGVARPLETRLQARCSACEYRSECKGEAGAKVYPIILPRNSKASGRKAIVD